MGWFRWLRRALIRGALLGVLLAIGAAIMSGAGGLRPVPLDQAFAKLTLAGLGWAAAYGALGLGAVRVVLRFLPGETGRATGGGLLMGAAAIAAVHQASLYVLFHALDYAPEPGFQFLAWRPFGLPAFYTLLLLGAVGGAVLSLLLRWMRFLPDLLFGAVYGAIGLTVLAGILPIPGLPGFAAAGPGLWIWIAVNGGWGWATAFMLRPMELRGWA